YQSRYVDITEVFHYPILLSLMDNWIRWVCERQILYKDNFLLRSEEHTSELQSRFDLVCRLLLAEHDDNTWKDDESGQLSRADKGEPLQPSHPSPTSYYDRVS